MYPKLTPDIANAVKNCKLQYIGVYKQKACDLFILIATFNPSCQQQCFAQNMQVSHVLSRDMLNIQCTSWKIKIFKPMIIKIFIYTIFEWEVQNLYRCALNLYWFTISKFVIDQEKGWVATFSSFVIESLKIKRWWCSV